MLWLNKFIQKTKSKDLRFYIAISLLFLVVVFTQKNIWFGEQSRSDLRVLEKEIAALTEERIRLENENKFKCPCHGSGFRKTGIHFEGPAPRPLERYRIVLGDDGQILVDKSRRYQQEKGQWSDPESFLKI